MNQCDVCKDETLPDIDNPICQICGYAPKEKTIKDKDACKKHYEGLKNHRYNWVEAVQFLGRIEEFTRHSRAAIGRLVDIARSTVTQDIQLAQGLKDRPELKKIASKVTAHETLNQTFKTKALDEEEKLHRNLYNNWDKTPFAEEWELVRTGSSAGKLNTDKIGELDMLAKNKSGNKWLVIELKKGPGSDKTIGQILRYMGWVKEKKAGEKDSVEGLIICGEYHLAMDYALMCLFQSNRPRIPFHSGHLFHLNPATLSERSDAVFFVFTLPFPILSSLSFSFSLILLSIEFYGRCEPGGPGWHRQGLGRQSVHASVQPATDW
jgi:hypothetical protein